MLYSVCFRSGKSELRAWDYSKSFLTSVHSSYKVVKNKNLINKTKTKNWTPAYLSFVSNKLANTEHGGRYEAHGTNKIHDP